MLYIHEFQTNSEFDAVYNGSGYTEPWVSYVVENGGVSYNKPNPFNGYAYVDLGLSSGTLWATCNVGASSPEEYGGYYAWGEVAEKSGGSAYASDWSDYAWGTSSSNMTKYNSTDGKTILDTEDDAARVVMGGEWHLPTRAQLNELYRLTSTWKTVNGVAGREFSGTNGNTLFIPAAGYKSNGSLSSAGSYAYIWSSNLSLDNASGQAGAMFFNNASVNITNNGSGRMYGNSCRGVVG